MGKEFFRSPSQLNIENVQLAKECQIVLKNFYFPTLLGVDLWLWPLERSSALKDPVCGLENFSGFLDQVFIFELLLQSDKF